MVSPELVRIDIPVMVLAACVPVFLSGRRVTRLESGLFVAAYVGYLCYLVLART